MIPNPSQFLLFISAALLLLLIPGPAVFYIVGRSIGTAAAQASYPR